MPDGNTTINGTLTATAITLTSTVTAIYVNGGGKSIFTGNVGISNITPWAPLNIGTVDSVSDGYIVFSKNAGGGSLRNCRVGFSSGFGFSIGDFGTSNNNTNTWTVQFAIAYNAPFASLGVDGTGRVLMQYGYGTTSDERVKTNIRTIENALEKTLKIKRC